MKLLRALRIAIACSFFGHNFRFVSALQRTHWRVRCVRCEKHFAYGVLSQSLVPWDRYMEAIWPLEKCEQQTNAQLKGVSRKAPGQTSTASAPAQVQ